MGLFTQMFKENASRIFSKVTTPQYEEDINHNEVAMPIKTAQKTSKKVTKKVTKTSSTASSPKTKEAKVLVCANGGECFWLQDGRVLSTLVDLKDALVGMADDVFSHHVTTERNDFADWVQFVLQDARCAAALRKAEDPSAAHTVTVTHLKYYRI